MSISDSCISMQFFEDRGSKLYDLLPMCKFEQPYIQLSTSSINNILSHNKMLSKRKQPPDGGGGRRNRSDEAAWGDLVDLAKYALHPPVGSMQALLLVR